MENIIRVIDSQGEECEMHTETSELLANYRMDFHDAAFRLPEKYTVEHLRYINHPHIGADIKLSLGALEAANYLNHKNLQQIAENINIASLF